jgi:predicted RNase H-like HicB family nuclease
MTTDELTPSRPFIIVVPIRVEAIAHPAEEGGFWAEVPALPGCYTQAESLDELQANIIEAAEEWLEARRNLANQRKNDEGKG